jgi:hypothetical protein
MPRDIFNAGLLATPEPPVITRAKLESAISIDGKHSLEQLKKLVISGISTTAWHRQLLMNDD